jgi:RHS repeat-associated protein
LVTVSDKKEGIDQGTDGKADYYEADVESATDYYPYGMAQPWRSFLSSTYRFGFNGKENEQGWGNQTTQDYGFRFYNANIARFLSVDPLAAAYPWYTPYQFAGNMPVWATDLDGLEPDPQTGQINVNVVFSKSENSNLSDQDVERLACEFETNCGNTFEAYTYNGNQINVTGNSNFTTDPNNINPNWMTINVVFSNIGDNPSYALPNKNLIVINENTWTGKDDNTAAHEFGHIFGLADRYIDGQMTNGTNTTHMIRTTVPLVLIDKKGKPIDSEYKYLNNLYSNPSGTGNGALTSYQLNIIFQRKTETTWNRNWGALYFDKAAEAPFNIFDGVRIPRFSSKFEYYFEYNQVSKASQVEISKLLIISH